MSNDIFFTDQGEGFPVIFIHGFCETQAMWDDFKTPFLDNYRVITIDLPGFGQSKLPPRQFSIADIGHMILSFIEERLQVEKTVVIGHSLGGYVALEMVKERPTLFSGLSLFHSTAFEDGAEKKASRDKTIEFVEKRGVEVFATSFVPSLFFSQNRKRLEKTIDRAVAMAAQTPMPTLITYSKAMRDRKDRSDVLKEFENPISFIAGDKDTSVPLESTSEQVLLPKRAIVNILQKTGHMGMFEQQEKTQGFIQDFLRLCAHS